MTYRIHCINSLPYLLFLASEEILLLPMTDQKTATYNLIKQKHFVDPLTKAPLYNIQDNVILRIRDINAIQPLTDKLLCDLTDIPYTPQVDPKQQIHEIQNNSLFQNMQHKGSVLGLFEIVERMMHTLSYGKGKTPSSLVDPLSSGYRLMCTEVTAIVAACLEGWNIPVRIGLGFGLNSEFDHDGERYRYFMDEIPGFGPTQHCWIEAYLNGEWIVFDPTIYFNKAKKNPSQSLLEKYREVALQNYPEASLYQWALPDYMKMPYPSNFRKSLLMISGGIDSTAALIYLLSQTSDVVHVHHVNLSHGDLRVKVEYDALRRILEYCQENYRPFEYTESTVDTIAPNGSSTDDIYHVMYAAAQVAIFDHRGHHFNQVLCGALELEEEELYVPGAKKRVREATELFNLFMSFYPEIPLPDCQIAFLKNWTKNDAWQILPPPLQKIVWYCRNPISSGSNYIACLKCESCIHVQNVVA